MDILTNILEDIYGFPVSEDDKGARFPNLVSTARLQDTQAIPAINLLRSLRQTQRLRDPNKKITHLKRNMDQHLAYGFEVDDLHQKLTEFDKDMARRCSVAAAEALYAKKLSELMTDLSIIKSLGLNNRSVHFALIKLHEDLIAVVQNKLEQIKFERSTNDAGRYSLSSKILSGLQSLPAQELLSGNGERTPELFGWKEGDLPDMRVILVTRKGYLAALETYVSLENFRHYCQSEALLEASNVLGVRHHIITDPWFMDVILQDDPERLDGNFANRLIEASRQIKAAGIAHYEDAASVREDINERNTLLKRAAVRFTQDMILRELGFELGFFVRSNFTLGDSDLNRE